MLAKPFRPSDHRPGAGRVGRERMDRRSLRRVAGALCLILAFYCLVAAAATLQAAPTVPGEPGTARTPERPPVRLPLLVPILFLVFVVVLAAVARRGRRTGLSRSRSEPDSAPAPSPRSQVSGRR
jgi:hypothetical protein